MTQYSQSIGKKNPIALYQSEYLTLVVLYFTGALIEKQSFHDDVLHGKAPKNGIYEDAEGFWITAAAPIKLNDGSVVGSD